MDISSEDTPQQALQKRRNIMGAAISTDPDICVNMIPRRGGAISTIQPAKNAVVVQLLEVGTEENGREIRRFIHIECLDNKLLPDLEKEAMRILRDGNPGV